MCSTVTVAQIDSAAADTVAGKKSALTRFSRLLQRCQQKQATQEV